MEKTLSGPAANLHKVRVYPGALIGLLLLSSSFALAQTPQVLHIGSSGASAISASGVKEEDAIKVLTDFVKAQTGFDNEIIRCKTSMEMANSLESGKIQLADFQGYEFAWAKHRYPKLTPIAVAVTGMIYNHVCVVIPKDNPAGGIAAFQGKTLSLPHVMAGNLRLVLDKLCKETQKPLDAFFGKITTPNNTEDAVDDVVDGVVQLAAVDRFSLDAYRRRKPARFAKVRVLMESPPLPPPLIAYYAGKLDPADVKKVESGLLKANKSEKGAQLLRLFKLTAFEPVPTDFDQIIEATYKEYPPNDVTASRAAPAPRRP